MDALTATAAKSGIAPAEGDDLDVAKAQLQLDQDELADAVEDVARETGDPRGRIQRELDARGVAMKKAEAYGAGQKATAVAAVRKHGTLAARLDAWFEQRNRARLLAQAEAKANDDASKMATEHASMESLSAKTGAGIVGMAGSARVKMLEAMATRRAEMSIADDRGQTEQQLAAVYGRWQQQVWTQHHILGYLILQSLALVTAPDPGDDIARSGWTHGGRPGDDGSAPATHAAQHPDPGAGGRGPAGRAAGDPGRTAADYDHPGPDDGRVDGGLPGLHPGVLRLVCV